MAVVNCSGRLKVRRCGLVSRFSGADELLVAVNIEEQTNSFPRGRLVPADGFSLVTGIPLRNSAVLMVPVPLSIGRLAQDAAPRCLAGAAVIHGQSQAPGGSQLDENRRQPAPTQHRTLRPRFNVQLAVGIRQDPFHENF